MYITVPVKYLQTVSMKLIIVIKVFLFRLDWTTPNYGQFNKKAVIKVILLHTQTSYSEYSQYNQYARSHSGSVRWHCVSFILYVC